MKNKGTPKTLLEAIHNAFNQIENANEKNGIEVLEKDPCEIIHSHVKDFLAQHWGCLNLLNSKQDNELLKASLDHTWNAIQNGNLKALAGGLYGSRN